MEKNGSAQELSSVSSFFISPSEEKRGLSAQIPELKGIAWGHPKDDCEIEETVTVRKRVAYPNTQSAQESMKKTLFNLVQEGYSLSRIELRRTSETNEPGNRIVTTEEIALYRK